MYSGSTAQRERNFGHASDNLNVCFSELTGSTATSDQIDTAAAVTPIAAPLLLIPIKPPLRFDRVKTTQLLRLLCQGALNPSDLLVDVVTLQIAL